MSRTSYLRLLGLGLVLALAGCPNDEPTDKPGPVDLAVSTLTVSRASGLAADGADKTEITVRVLDSKQKGISGKTVALAATGEGNTLVQPSAVTNDLGVATGSLASTVAGDKTITATIDGAKMQAQKTVNFTAQIQPAAKLSFTVQPSTVVLGQKIAPAVQVTFLDAAGLLTPVTETVTLKIGDNAGGATLGGTLTSTAVAGVATFADLTLNKPGTGYTLVASSAAVTGPVTSAAFNVTAGSVAALVISNLSTTPTAGVAGDVTVTAQDAQGNTVTGYTGTVTLTSSDTKATLPAAYTFTAADQGVHLFTGVAFKTSGAQTLTAGDGTLSATANVTVAAAAAAKLSVTGLNSPFTAGTVGTLVVKALDAFDNVAVGYGGTVMFSSNDAQAQLPADYAFVTGDQGTRSFSVSLRTVGTREVTASDQAASLTASQAGIQVVPAAVQGFKITGLPTSVVAGEVTAFTVTAVDAFGNVNTGYAGQVGFTASDANAVLPAASALTLGTGNFNVTFKTAGAQSITAKDGALTSTANTTVQPGATTTLKFVNPPAATYAGANATFTVAARDAFGNVTPSYAKTVSFTSSDAAAVLPPSSVLTAGTRTFTVVFNTVKATAQWLKVTDATLSDQVDVTVQAGSVSALRITGLAASATAGTPTSFTVTAVDAAGNPATAYTGTVTFTSSTDSTAVLPAATTLTNGTGTFEVTFKKVGAQSITVTDSGLTDTKSTTVAPGATAGFSVTGLAANVIAGTAASFTVTAQDAFGNTTPAFAGTVTFESSDTAATLPAPGMLASGTGSFSVTFATSGTQSVTAKSGALTGTASTTVTSGSIASLTIALPATATAGVATSFTVTAKDASGNTATSYTGPVTLTSSDPQATLPATAALTAGVDTVNVTFKTAGSQSVTAADGAITDTKSATVAPAATSGLAISGLAAEIDAGSATSFTVRAVDAFGNTTPGHAATVTITSTDSAATLPAPAALASGTANFSITLKTAGSRTVTASDGTLSASASILVKATAVNGLMVSGIPTPLNAGAPASVTVKAVDAQGNTVTGYAGTIHFTSNDTRATLPGDFTFNGTEGGTHSFDNGVVLRTPTTTATVTATDTGNGSINGAQGPIVVQVGPAAKLAFVTQPTNAGVGATITPAVTVAIQDAGGNTVTSATDNVTLALQNPRGATLSGTLTQAAVAGVATFANLKVGTQNTGYILAATSGTLTAANSAAFDVSGCPTGYTGPTCSDCATGYHLDGTNCVDACTAPNPCSAVPAAICKNGTTATTYAAQCTVAGSAPYFTCAYPGTDVACTGGQVCYTGACVNDLCAANPCTAKVPACQDSAHRVTYTVTCAMNSTSTYECTDVPGTPEDCTVTAGNACYSGTCQPAVAAAAGDLLVTEVMHSPTGGSDDARWFEVKNLSAKLINLAGVLVEETVGAKSFTIATTSPVLVPPNGYLVIGGSTNVAANGGAKVDLAWTGGFTLSASGHLKLSIPGATPVVLADLTWGAGFPATTGKSMNLSSKVFSKKSMNGKTAANYAWWWCDATAEIKTGGDLGTPGAANGDCGADSAPPIGWCKLQWPTSLSSEAMVPATVYARFHKATLTDRTNPNVDFYPFVRGEFGYGTGTDATAWTSWQVADFNAGYSDGSNNDEMQVGATFATAGTFNYGYRFTLLDPETGTAIAGSTVYCDTAGVSSGTTGTWGQATVTVGAGTGSAQIGIVRAATSFTTKTATITQPVERVYVTYVKPALTGATGNDLVGFFVQGTQSGPGIHVALDPATLSPALAVGDQVSFTVTKTDWVNGVRQVTTLESLTRHSTGFAVAGLVTDVNAATDLVSAIDNYDSRMVKLTGAVTAPFATASTPFMSAAIDTTGMVGNANLKLRLPTALQTKYDLVTGCQVSLLGSPMWRYSHPTTNATTAQPAAWWDGDFTVAGCPAPKVATASATSATTVMVNFDRSLAAASVTSGAFTIPGLTVSAAALQTNTKQVELTTSSQTSGTSYTVTVGTSVTDILGSAVGTTNNTATFSGFGSGPTPHLVINAVSSRGTTAADEYVVLYNPTSAPISLAGYAIWYSSSSGSAPANKNAAFTGVSIPAGKYLLIAASGYVTVGGVTRDVLFDGGIGDAATVWLTNTTTAPTSVTSANVVDVVGFGTLTSSFYEGAGPAPS